MFDEEGEKLPEVSKKKSELGQKYELEVEDEPGINVTKVKEILKAEDKFDKQLAKEKRKAKKREEKLKNKQNSKRNQQTQVHLAKKVFRRP